MRVKVFAALVLLTGTLSSTRFTAALLLICVLSAPVARSGNHAT